MWIWISPAMMTHPQRGSVHCDAEGWWWTPQASGLKRGPFATVQEAIAEAEKERGDG